ncbi:hypothetical protein SprV_0100060800 [Sparganum proliferum]
MVGTVMRFMGVDALEFESLALVKSAFFKYNLSLLTYRNAVVVFTDPEIRIVVGFPPGSENILSFTIGLTFDDQDFTEHYNSVPLTRYARQEVLEKENCVAFYIRPPRPGAYKLLIYAKHRQGEAAIASDPPESTENLYGAVCEYRLMARVSHNVCLPPFPPCQTGNYGQTEMVKRFNIRAVCREPAIRAIQGTVELRFTSVDPNRPLPRLMGQLKCTLLSAEALEHCILQRTLSYTESVLLIFLPDAGEYGLEVYANEPDRDGSSYFAVSVCSNFWIGARGRFWPPPSSSSSSSPSSSSPSSSSSSYYYYYYSVLPPLLTKIELTGVADNHTRNLQSSARF